MKQIATHLRHILSGLAGIGTYLATMTPVDPATVEQANQAGADLVDPLAALLSVVAIIITRLVLGWLGRKFPALGERMGNAASKGVSGGTSLMLLISTVAAVGGLLPSCADFRGTGGLYYRHPETGAKAGLSFGEDGASYSARVPLYDDQGNLIAWTEVKGPLSREVRATK